MSYFSLFQSTHPARGATIAAISSGLSTSFQSTHPARGATVRRPPFCFHFDISIHAPREGCDFAPRNDGGMWVISIHAPREGCDCQNQGSSSRMDYFNPRTPRGVRQLALRSGYYKHLFQSTHPARGATVRGGRPGSHRKNFNPRTPRGVRLLQEQEAELEQVFQSTHPARGATHRHIQGRQYSKISIHAPREGCDSSGLTRCAISHVFQSTHPARGATVFWYQPHIPQFYFNPRTPRGVRQQTLPKSREFAWLNLLICTRGRRLSIRKQTRLCSMKLSFMLFGCEPAGEGVSSWTSHATKSKVRLEGRSAYSQSVRSSAHSDFPGNKSGGCPVRDP